ncbi:MAG: hypothetical protein HY445_02075 [Candidatus Niyogibacteria bacterium]|nr:hypothetical protein [Candidatus Niyogibacteria bacterium]
MDKYVIPEEIIRKTLETPLSPKKEMLEPLNTYANENGLPFKILNHPEQFGDAEVHLTEGDEWEVIEGTVEFVVGGRLPDSAWEVQQDGISNPNELRAKEIEGGSRSILQAGQRLWVPPGVPHMHRGRGRSWITKIPKK